MSAPQLLISPPYVFVVLVQTYLVTFVIDGHGTPAWCTGT
jgi:hypothetical protein